MSAPSADIPTRPRLGTALEAFEASDGRIYLLRAGTHDDLVIEHATPRVRTLLALLRTGGLAVDDLAARLDALAPGDDEVRDALAALAEHGVLEESPTGRPTHLSPEELERYDRQLPYFAASGRDAESAQARLREARVTILGVGGLGSWALCGLACAGVGRFRIVDDDTIDLSNLNRQLLYRHGDVGRRKVEAAAEAIAAFDPSAEIEAIAARVASPDDAARVADGADIVVVTADWPMYELPRWVNRACLAAEVPWITASQVPPLVRVGPTHVPGRTACLECQERAARRDFPLYDELAEWRQAHPTTATTLGWASGLVGSVLAGEVVHHLTGVVEPATTSAAVVIDLATLAATRERIDRDPECPACGDL